jgi:transposase
MAALSTDLRQRIVDYYTTKKTATYESTARNFSVAVSTVSRLLRLSRETKSVIPRPRKRKYNRLIDSQWLLKHATNYPDDRLIDRVEALRSETGISVSICRMWYALKELGWTHKKKRFTQKSGNQNVSKNYGKNSRKSKQNFQQKD